jgi:hypothetical protein
MAKVKRNLILEGLSGKFGDVVFRHTKNGKTIICHKPDFSSRQFSQDQLDHQERVKLASAYGVANKENPVYIQKAKGTDKNAYNIAFKDWFHPPVLHGVQYRDGHIRVEVRDDVMVARVVVTVLDENEEGKTLEQGEAQLVYGSFWEYQSASQGRVRVEARDLPGNRVQHEYCPPPRHSGSWEQAS